MERVELGDLVRCKITGFEGICVARTEWISGCARITLQPPCGKDGKVPEGQTFDEPMVEVKKRAKLKVPDLGWATP